MRNSSPLFFIPAEEVLKHLGTICLFRSDIFRPPTHLRQWFDQVAAWRIESPGALWSVFIIASWIEVRNGVQVQN